MSSYQSVGSSYCRLPFFALALLFYCLTRICFICEAMFPSTSHSSTMKSPVTWGKDKSASSARSPVLFLQKWSTVYLSLHIDRLLPDFHAGGKTVAVLHKNSLDIKLCSLMFFYVCLHQDKVSSFQLAQHFFFVKTDVDISTDLYFWALSDLVIICNNLRRGPYAMVERTERAKPLTLWQKF